MNIIEKLVTNSDCYKCNRTITPKGIMVHSTGCKITASSLISRWNKPGKDVCAHAVIDNTGVFQVLPWTHRSWHCGRDGNNTHISFEICEPAKMSGYNVTKNVDYFNAVYTLSVELCATLCKLYKLSAKNIICHSEGNKIGIASNHADVMHWFPKHGKSMDTFRSDVQKLLDADEVEIKVVTPVISNSVVNPYTEPTSNLKKGSKGESVKWVQWHLKRLKYDIGKYGIDGDFGSSTLSAVKKFQKANKLTADGIVGKLTREKLKK